MALKFLGNGKVWKTKATGSVAKCCLLCLFLGMKGTMDMTVCGINGCYIFRKNRYNGPMRRRLILHRQEGGYWRPLLLQNLIKLE